MRFLQADQIFNGQIFLEPNSVLVLDDKNCFVEVISADKTDASRIEKHVGIICPGFVNAHCHLELSHFKNVIEERTGMLNFAKGIITKRGNFDQKQIQEAIVVADKKMWENGIVAVGDVCNTTDSFEKKSKSTIYYHSFIELIGFIPEQAEPVFAKGKEILSEAKKLNLKASLVPHAPYSVSENLLQKINAESKINKLPITIHNQESEAENDFFIGKKGAFAELYEFLKMNIDFFKPSGKSSIQTYLKNLSDSSNLILVHNTFSSGEDISYASDLHKNLYWCFCPNANLYIENKLPEVNNFISENCKIVIGTDSLASNHNISVLDEINVLLKNFENVSIENVLKWSTYNGALALNIQDNFGSFIPNKNSGLNLVSRKSRELNFSQKLA